jgi:hypothetical protein
MELDVISFTGYASRLLAFVAIYKFRLMNSRFNQVPFFIYVHVVCLSGFYMYKEPLPITRIDGTTVVKFFFVYNRLYMTISALLRDWQLDRP